MDESVTVFPFEGSETDKTGKTYSVSNREFLEMVFGTELTDVLPIVVGFEGAPATVPNKVWFGKPWTGNDAFSPDNNNYFSLAVFRPEQSLVREALDRE